MNVLSCVRVAIPLGADGWYVVTDQCYFCSYLLIVDYEAKLCKHSVKWLLVNTYPNQYSIHFRVHIPICYSLTSVMPVQFAGIVLTLCQNVKHEQFEYTTEVECIHLFRRKKGSSTTKGDHSMDRTCNQVTNPVPSDFLVILNEPWRGISNNVVCATSRALRSACAYAQSDQSLC